ncbi:MAG: hypothetical protein KDD04_01780, partial [Sinomicrobium sp.]|nr:hypothetical protein [Sinomicrobium sp.]
LGRTFHETLDAHKAFATKEQPERFLHIIYWLGKLAVEEETSGNKRTITFSPILRERLGHHIHGEIWANTIKKTLKDKNLLKRPLHIISANMHSVMNSVYAMRVLKDDFDGNAEELVIYEALSKAGNERLRDKVRAFAEENGMISLDDASGTNIDVQLFDTAKIELNGTGFTIDRSLPEAEKPVLLVMDYAFGEQAYETIDELLKPYKESKDKSHHLNVISVSIMGKAGILCGKKGDIMIPTAHIFEGTADNYPFKNELSKEDFGGNGLSVYEGSMFTVLGTSLQNKDILEFFYKSTWNTIGIEMEGAHYQKAIQSASRIRKSISENVKVRYAYYASDNPLETGSTLASGGLGVTGVKPTYLITKKILEQVFNS